MAAATKALEADSVKTTPTDPLARPVAPNRVAMEEGVTNTAAATKVPEEA